MRRHRKSVGGGFSLLAVPCLLGAAFAMFGGARRAQASAAPAGGAGAAPWTLVVSRTSSGAAPPLQLDPSRQYAALIFVEGVAASVATGSMVEDKLRERAEWAQVQAWDSPDEIPWTVKSAFGAAELQPMPGRFWVFGRPGARKSIKTDNVLRAYARPARQEAAELQP